MTVIKKVCLGVGCIFGVWFFWWLGGVCRGFPTEKGKLHLRSKHVLCCLGQPVLARVRDHI